MKRTSFAFAGLVLAFFACAQPPIPYEGVALPADVIEPEGFALPAGITDAMVQEGQGIYAGAGICAVCHGPDATGGIGPNLTDAEWLIGDGEYEQLVTRILDGVSAAEATFRRGATMPPKGGSGITEAQVRAVAAYVWTLSH
jgi:mono/diheme cytochrome c family protein